MQNRPRFYSPFSCFSSQGARLKLTKPQPITRLENGKLVGRCAWYAPVPQPALVSRGLAPVAPSEGLYLKLQNSGLISPSSGHSRIVLVYAL